MKSLQASGKIGALGEAALREAVAGVFRGLDLLHFSVRAQQAGLLTLKLLMAYIPGYLVVRAAVADEIDAVLRAMRRFPDDVAAQESGLKALGCSCLGVATQPARQARLIAAGGVTVALAAMRRHADSDAAVGGALFALRAMVTANPIEASRLGLSSAGIFVEVLETYEDSGTDGPCHRASDLLDALATSGSAAALDAVVSAGAVAAVVACSLYHAGNPLLQNALWSLMNTLVGKSAAARGSAKDEGVVQACAGCLHRSDELSGNKRLVKVVSDVLAKMAMIL